MPPAERIEITDLLLDIGPDGTRRPVSKRALLDRCHLAGDRWAARLVEALPAADDVLDADHVDRLIVAVHGEIQRLAEEFRHGARVQGLLAPVLATLRDAGEPGPYRIVDIGCGSGYVVRWLAAHVTDPDVEVVGVDLNPALVRAAAAVAADEGLPCRFLAADAFSLAEPATILISTGVLHHFRGHDLERFFRRHAAPGPAAFVHLDFQPSALAGLGSWLFHRTRMRLGISRHDGIRSAQRAHPPAHLARTMARAAPSHVSWTSARTVRFTPLPCVLTMLVGVRADLAPALVAHLGPAARRLEPTA